MTVTSSLLTFLVAAGILAITPGMDRVTGCVLIAFGAKLALSRR
ncbi:MULTISPECIES: hypothetical protein [Corallococcus]|nr:MULTISPECIES: hypothetical protein [Corallococcus]